MDKEQFSTRMRDGLKIFRYKSYEEMAEDICDRPCNDIYIESCLVDYSSFIKEYNIPVDIDTFVSQYWNIIPYFAVEKLEAGTDVYNGFFHKLTNETIIKPMYRNNETGADVIELNLFASYSFPGFLYYFPDFFRKPIERMVDKKCQKAYLITKTNQLQS